MLAAALGQRYQRLLPVHPKATHRFYHLVDFRAITVNDTGGRYRSLVLEVRTYNTVSTVLKP